MVYSIREVMSMAAVEKAKVFSSGRSQAVRIPARYRFRTNEVFLRHDPVSGAITLSEAPPRRPWGEVFAALDDVIASEGELEMDRDTREAAEREEL